MSPALRNLGIPRCLMMNKEKNKQEHLALGHEILYKTLECVRLHVDADSKTYGSALG